MRNFKNNIWSINIYLNYFMAPAKILRFPLRAYLMCRVPYRGCKKSTTTVCQYVLGWMKKNQVAVAQMKKIHLWHNGKVKSGKYEQGHRNDSNKAWRMYKITEAATRGVLCKKVILEISQSSQGNTCARVSFLQTLAQVLSCKFCEISKNTFFIKHLWTTASSISWNQEHS